MISQHFTFHALRGEMGLVLTEIDGADRDGMSGHRMKRKKSSYFKSCFVELWVLLAPAVVSVIQLPI